MNTNYSQYEDYGKLVSMMDKQYQTPGVQECTEQVITELFTDLKSPKEPIEEVRERIFKPVVVKEGGK